MSEAQGIMAKVDGDDTKFIALALAVENDGMWSRDGHFSMQKAVKTWKTSGILEFLGG